MEKEKKIKAIVKRKYIYIEPTPKYDIPNGLVVELFEPSNPEVEPYATTDIIKGQKKYTKPNKGTLDSPDYNTVKRAWIQHTPLIKRRHIKTIKESIYFKTLNKKEKPYTYLRWKGLDLIKATPLERLIMLELDRTFAVADWMFGQKEDSWNRKDMRRFVKDLSKKIENNIN